MKFQLGKIVLHLIDETINQSECILKNLGCYLDNKVLMEKQVSMAISKSFFHLKLISQIIRCLNKSVCERLINAVVTSHLDFSQFIIIWVTKSTKTAMQLV